MALALAFGCGGDDDGDVRTEDRGGDVLDSGATIPEAKPVMDAGLVRDGGRDGAVEDSGPSGATLVDDLTLAQARAQCEKVTKGAQKAVDNFQQAMCTMVGVLVEEQRPGNCATARDRCAQNAANEEPDVSMPIFDCSSEQSFGCPGLTVADIDACAREYGSLATQFASFTCRSTTAEVNAARQSAVGGPPACQAMQRKCAGA
jgi:hypothetical protein